MAHEQASGLSPFESIRQFDEQGHEYWSARSMSKLLGYTEYGKFQNVLKKAEIACQGSGQAVSDHFSHVSDMISTGKGAKRPVEDVHLSRYACYLLIQNSDPEKPIVSLGQTYFALQTRRQELTDQNEMDMPEDQLRLIRRSQLAINNRQLAETAQGAGVITTRDFAIFQDHGYAGLYGGLKAKDIRRKKQEASGKDVKEISDWMNSDELTANAFRSSLTRQKIQREHIQDKERANQAHHDMGRAVRKTIIETGATLPENHQTPTKSITQLQREERKRFIQEQQQPSLFDDLDE